MTDHTPLQEDEIEAIADKLAHKLADKVTDEAIRRAQLGIGKAVVRAVFVVVGIGVLALLAWLSKGGYLVRGGS